jgi:hypothetical protein
VGRGQPWVEITVEGAERERIAVEAVKRLLGN